MNSKYDLIVAGGGMSGVAAAVAAAREGLNVLLIEQYGYLGGMATAGLVNPFMPYYLKDENEKWDLTSPINRGIFGEVISSLKELGGLHKNTWTFNEEVLKIVLDRMMKKYNVTVLFHSFLHDVICREGRVNSITVINKSGKMSFEAEFFIDATGDADLAKNAGAQCEIGRAEDHTCQPMSLCFRLANVDLDRFDKEEATKKYCKFREKGLIKNPREDILTFENMIDGVVHFNTTRIVNKSGVNAEDLTAAEIEAREQMFEMYQFLKNEIPGFENCKLLMSAPQIGIRETRRVMGEYLLTKQDILSARKFEDAVARGDYPIDIHNPCGTGTEMIQIPPMDYYTIPLRSLIPLGIENLLIAGRPISATHEAHSAYRVMPITTCIGEGAGCAAALAFNNNCNVRDVGADRLHEMMDKYGALY